MLVPPVVTCCVTNCCRRMEGKSNKWEKQVEYTNVVKLECKIPMEIDRKFVGHPLAVMGMIETLDHATIDG